MITNMFPAVILAGGLATRLRPITETIPKALVEINGAPFILHQLKLLKARGITRLVLCVGYLGEMIEEVLGDGRDFGVHITYSYDGDRLLGTGGAIKKALPHLGEQFFVFYGDSYLVCDYAAVQASFVSQQKLALMTVFCNQGAWDTSNVEYTDGRIVVYDKKNITSRMKYIDYGLGIFHRDAFQSVSTNEVSDLADLYQKMLNENQLAAYEVHQRFYEVGSFTGITELEYYLSQNNA